MAGTAVRGAVAGQEEDRLRQLMPPPARRPPALSAVQLPGDRGIPKEVLPEEDYTDGIAAIIERDYFPDIPKLRNQLEWAHAVKSGDPTAIRQAQINISRRRAGLATPAVQAGVTGGVASTPGGWNATPGTALLRTPAMTPVVGHGLADALGATPAASSLAVGGATPAAHGSSAAPVAGVGAPAVEELRAPPMSLDTFLATHTSEDNASFAKIHAKDAARKRHRNAHLLEDKNQPLLLLGPGSNPQEDYGTSGQQPMTLAFPRHHPTSALYYVPDQKPLSASEAQVQAQRPKKLININGTRLKPLVADDPVVVPAQAIVPGVQGAGDDQQPAAKQWGPSEVAGRDYNRLSTPALTPGAMGQSPLMTWGDLASTPLRLDLEDHGVVLDEKALKGPTFDIQHVSKREQAGLQLAAAGSLRELKRRQREARQAAVVAAALTPGAAAALAGATPQGAGRPWSAATPTPVRAAAGKATPLRAGTTLPPRPGTGTGVATMSEAALRLAKQIKQRHVIAGAGTPASATDKALRASYSAGAGGIARAATPGGLHGARAATPGAATPAGKRDTATPSLKAGAEASAGKGGSITDDLLRI